MRRHNTHRSAVVGGAIALAFGLSVLSACDDPPPPPKKNSAVDTTASDALKSPEEDETPEVAYAYSPIGKRDPFKSLFEEISKVQGSEELTELQRYDIDQLKLIAIITGPATPYAMVEDPQKKGHTVTRGTLIGKNWGRISAVTQRCLTVKEEYRDYTGRKHANEVDLCLPEPPALKLD